MYPYPSGKMHMGHVRNYSIGDAVARYKRMTGHDVLYPMGFDSFGMPAENAAIKEGGHPLKSQNEIWHLYQQIKRMGFSYDWRRVVKSPDQLLQMEPMVLYQILQWTCFQNLPLSIGVIHVIQFWPMSRLRRAAAGDVMVL